MRSRTTEIKKKKKRKKEKIKRRKNKEDEKYEMETGKAKRSVGCLGVKAVVNSFTRSYSFIVSFTSRFLSGFVVFGNESLLHAVGWLCGRDRNVTDSTVLRNMLARNVRYLPATKARRMATKVVASLS